RVARVTWTARWISPSKGEIASLAGAQDDGVKSNQYSSMDLKLENKTALVTGSTAGIGLAIAKALAAEGARVIVNGRSEARVSEAIASIRAKVPTAKLEGLALDLSKADAAAQTTKRHPDVDILVNNLGVYEVMDFEQITDA